MSKIITTIARARYRARQGDGRGDSEDASPEEDVIATRYEPEPLGEPTPPPEDDVIATRYEPDTLGEPTPPP